MQRHDVASTASTSLHDVNITSPQRRCKVMTLHRRWGDVIFTSCAHDVNITSPQRRAHDVNITSPQRRCNVIDVEATLYLLHVPAGKALLTFWRINLSVRMRSPLTINMFWSLAGHTVYETEKHRFWRDFADAQDRLNLCCSHML